MTNACRDEASAAVFQSGRPAPERVHASRSKPQNVVLEKIAESSGGRAVLRTHKSLDEEYLLRAAAADPPSDDAESANSPVLPAHALADVTQQHSAAASKSDGEMYVYRSLPEGSRYSSQCDVESSSSEQSSSVTADAGAEKPCIATAGKKSRKSFLHNLMHRNESKDGGVDKDRKLRTQEIRLSQLSDDVIDWPTSPTTPTCVSKPSSKLLSDNNASIINKNLQDVHDHDDSDVNSVDCEMTSYLHLSGGLRRGSKSDYDLKRRPLTPEPSLASGRDEQMTSWSKSNEQLVSQSCTALELRAARKPSSQHCSPACDAPDDVDGREKRFSFVRKLSRKVKSMTASKGISAGDITPGEVFVDVVNSALKKRRANKFEVIDLTDDDVGEKPPVRKLTYSRLLAQLGRSSPTARVSSATTRSPFPVSCLLRVHDRP